MEFIEADYENIHFRIEEARYKFSPEELAEAKLIWDKKVSENPRIFNGQAFAGYGYDLIDGKHIITVTDVLYDKFIWNRETGRSLPGFSSLVVGVVLHKDGKVYLPIRGGTTYFSGRLHPVLGGVDYDESISGQDLGYYIKSIGFKELEEEVGLDNSISLDDLQFWGFLYDAKLERFDMIFLCECEIKSLTNWENSGVGVFTRAEFEEKLKAEPDAFLPTQQALFPAILKEDKIWE